MVSLQINNIPIKVSEDCTIIEAAKLIGIDIPTLCYLKDINEIGACRACVVEVKGTDSLATACNTTVKEGMEVFTNTFKVRSARRTNIQLILSQHDSQCTTCERSGNCKLQNISNDLGIMNVPYKEELKKEHWNQDFPLSRDSKKCINCMRCVNVCEKVQKIGVWDILGSGSRTSVAVGSGRAIEETNCILCGQCITHCPVGALTARNDIDKVYEALANPEITTIVQIAPAIRAAWAEEFNLSSEEVPVNKMVSALKAMGFDYVFDTTFAADLTIMEEGSELLERLVDIKKTGKPMFTSCCPGWVSFIKSKYPHMVNQLSTAKSPQQMFGAVAKSYFANSIGVSPDKIYVVSIMPCVAKKREAAELLDKKNMRQDVDLVITTREFDRMLRIDGINLDKLPEMSFDKLLGEGTGAGVIFGVTGGVMEAALRSAYYLKNGVNPKPESFVEIRGNEPWREAEFDFQDAMLKVAAVSGIGNTIKLIDAIERGEAHYDFVEVMACPGGCVGGGGQPIHCDDELAAKRGSLLYSLDTNNPLRFSHENYEVQTLYKDFLEKPLSHKAHELLHRGYVE